jgi:hypothetical protein
MKDLQIDQKKLLYAILRRMSFNLKKNVIPLLKHVSDTVHNKAITVAPVVNRSSKGHWSNVNAVSAVLEGVFNGFLRTHV